VNKRGKKQVSWVTRSMAKLKSIGLLVGALSFIISGLTSGGISYYFSVKLEQRKELVSTLNESRATLSRTTSSVVSDVAVFTRDCLEKKKCQKDPVIKSITNAQLVLLSTRKTLQPDDQFVSEYSSELSYLYDQVNRVNGLYDLKPFFESVPRLLSLSESIDEQLNNIIKK